MSTTPVSPRTAAPLGVVPSLLALLVLEVVGYLLAACLYRGR